MRIKKNTDDLTKMGVVALILFTFGIFIGALTIFYMPKEVVSEAHNQFSLTGEEATGFIGIFKTNFIIEFFWMFAIWLFAMGKVTHPLASATVLLRGILIGFCVEFIISGGENIKEALLVGIVPQCVISVPLMTICVTLCTKTGKEKRMGAYDGKYVNLGALITIFTLLSALLEASLVFAFMKIL